MHSTPNCATVAPQSTPNFGRLSAPHQRFENIENRAEQGKGNQVNPPRVASNPGSGIRQKAAAKAGFLCSPPRHGSRFEASFAALPPYKMLAGGGDFSVRVDALSVGVFVDQVLRAARRASALDSCRRH
jgi:hypothetical protein